MGMDVNSLREKNVTPRSNYLGNATLGKVVFIQVTLQTTEFNELADGVSDVVAHTKKSPSPIPRSTYRCRCVHGDEFEGGYGTPGARVCRMPGGEEEGADAELVTLASIVFRCESVRLSTTYRCTPQALTMPDEEAASHWQDLHNHGVTQTAQTLVTSFLTWCLRAHIERVSLSIDPSLIPSLDLPRLTPKYRHSTFIFCITVHRADARPLC
ncbi:hypothetical protein PISMIDRAFT_414082 [Pisolithus microcarpus 441]|uniref:Uncharacterized protein n=1 Tax=Pisolithus microcarpus 441 TaxID=765257 RepID=A0A0C9YGN4_9AGAM|nr:hypothetical protein BKA83DRAFT_414082 [Pisolithus microcarpus]KIK13059.1 hypothetical protein PISMIDRAFT_414082 [Pisolithus microcarpus 441]